MADMSCVELIGFVRPYHNDVNLYVTNISRRLDKETVQVKLQKIFSQYGLLYEVQVFHSLENLEAPISDETALNGSNLNQSSIYAFVKFYSAKAAKRAKESLSGKRLLDGQFLKVQFAHRKKIPEAVRHPLYMAKCTELANYYFGFNGWMTKIVQVEKLEKVECTDSKDDHINSSIFKCVIRLEIKGCDFFCFGTGYGGDYRVLQKETNPSRKLELLGFGKKLSHRHAYENAFKRVIIVSLDNGKVGVEINQEDTSECDLDELREDGIVNVNYVEEMLDSESDEDGEGQYKLQNKSLSDSVSVRNV
ncbi:RAD52 motif-containing protein 1-like [Montipora capricornis]|uniref:RAD52 motif-containing protein 1-like n=1 Tax=Montipora capricornis TaxID=246305 RepID=UPI0035F1A6D5